MVRAIISTARTHPNIVDRAQDRMIHAFPIILIEATTSSHIGSRAAQSLGSTTAPSRTDPSLLVPNQHDRDPEWSARHHPTTLCAQIQDERKQI